MSAVPGGTISRLLVLDQLPDAAPVVRVFRNGVRATTVTLSGSAQSYTVTYLVSTAWLPTDYVQVIAYPLFGGNQSAVEVFKGCLGTPPSLGGSVSSALVLDQIPDSTPTLSFVHDGTVDGAAVTSIVAGATGQEYVVMVTIPAGYSVGDDVSVLVSSLFGGLTYSTELWSLDLETVAADDGTTNYHSPAEIVQQLFIDAGIGTDPDLDPLQSWPVYSTNEPDLETLDEVITVTDTAGIEQGRTMVDGEEEMHYGVQVRVDARSHENYGWKKINSILTYCSRSVFRVPVTVEGTRYLVLNFARIGPALPVGKDIGAVKRSIFTFNPTVVIRRLS